MINTMRNVLQASSFLCSFILRGKNQNSTQEYPLEKSWPQRGQLAWDRELGIPCGSTGKDPPSPQQCPPRAGDEPGLFPKTGIKQETGTILGAGGRQSPAPPASLVCLQSHNQPDLDHCAGGTGILPDPGNHGQPQVDVVEAAESSLAPCWAWCRGALWGSSAWA